MTLFLVHAGQSASTVLYETSWEAAPANPAWTPGPVRPQNGWTNDAAGGVADLVVTNGSTDAIVNGQAVATPFGNQFQRFVANPSTTAGFTTFTWRDLGDGFADRPFGQDTLIGSIDLFIPQSQAADGSLYGLDAFDRSAGKDLITLAVQPNGRGVYMFFGNDLAASGGNIVPYDKWFNLAFSANYTSGVVRAYIDGFSLGAFAYPGGFIGTGFTDLDLFTYNPTNAPTTRSIFSDNFHVEASTTLPAPRLVIQTPTTNSHRLSWPPFFANWTLEYTSALTATSSWTTVTSPRSLTNGLISVDVTDASNFRAFRLRYP